MSAQFANQQPAGFKNRIEKVAIVGAGGYQGSHIVEQLLKGGKHTVTAITRPESTNKIVDGVVIKKVNYNDHNDLVSALKGQDALIVTLWVGASNEQQDKLIAAAAEAGVPWVIPNEWGGNSDDQINLDQMLAMPRREARKKIEESGLSWIGFANGFWYDYSLGFGEGTFGFDLDKHTVLMYADGHRKIDVSVWSSVATAVTNLLSLPVLPQDENDKSITVSHWRNKFVHTKAFTVDQWDMLHSVNRVLGLKESDWAIRYTEPEEVAAKGKEDMKKGDRSGFMRQMYSRVFFPDGAGRHTEVHGNDNGKLGLPEYDLDEWTKVMVDYVEQGKLTEYMSRTR